MLVLRFCGIRLLRFSVISGPWDSPHLVLILLPKLARVESAGMVAKIELGSGLVDSVGRDIFIGSRGRDLD